MPRAPANSTSQWVPWSEHPGKALDSTQKLISADAIAVAVVHEQKPQPDEVLACRGWDHQTLNDWLITSASQDNLFKQAKRRGGAASEKGSGENGSVLTAQYDHVMVHMSPESLPLRRWWLLLMARRAKPFAPDEQQLASLMIQQWRARFNQIEEPGMGRLLIGHDDRLITADPWTQAMLLREPSALPTLLESMHQIAAQRWGDGADFETHDFSIDLPKQLYWVCFHRRTVLSPPRLPQWYLEIRQLEPDELPPVGAVEDDRIAESIAFIHERFNKSPSLEQIAAAVHLSPFHFHRLFSKHVGISPKQYLQKKQLQMAKWMLRSSRESIGKIASRCGFSSHGHFTSTFTRLIEASPSQYREKH